MTDINGDISKTKYWSWKISTKEIIVWKEWLRIKREDKNKQYVNENDKIQIKERYKVKILLLTTLAN